MLVSGLAALVCHPPEPPTSAYLLISLVEFGCHWLQRLGSLGCGYVVQLLGVRVLARYPVTLEAVEQFVAHLRAG